MSTAPLTKRTLQLTPSDGSQLSRLLHNMLERCQDHPSIDGLREIHDALDDAIWLASWMRDYVQLDITLDESYDLLQSLSACLAEESLTPDEERICCQTIEMLSQPNLEPSSREQQAIKKSAATTL